ncbi:MAG: voltage-gated potassium channel Kch, partial [Thermoproteota archaeon]
MTRNTQDQIFDWKVIANILWQFTIISAIGWTAFSAPLSFIWSTPLTVSDGYIDAVISSVFIIDIIINFRNRNSEIESKVVSIDNWDKEPIPYNKTVWFPLDIFASIPFDLIVLSFGLGSTHKYLSLLRLFRVVRCLKIISIIKDAPKTLKMTMIVAGALTIIHWIACGWISINHLQGADIITIYNKAIYWAITTLTTIGYGDITPKTNLGRSYTMIIMILGVGTYGVVIGNVSRMIMLADKSKEERKEKFNDLNLFMK